ncbi:hypothetical protein FH972_019937 [Carpinus fangiana]|uniref:RING-type E3 ubiquitin transferase n=1 Tax=Carpinus fangiana TaxID=176857 RepID=A0A5N6RS74_9ROSI|nr:hypothetical protein FH972_019937 [Carpinus fangiana]
MEESQQPVRIESNGRNDSVLWRHTSTLPLTRLIASSGHHNHHDDDDDDSGIGGETNCGYYYYYYYNYYWKPIVVLDLAFLVVAVVVLLSTFKETPSTPLRVWLSGYSLHCVFHVAFLYLHSLFRFSSARDPPLSHACIVKRLESINTIISSVWWVLGFYWIVVGGQSLLQDSPRLYWLTVVFLAFDVFFIFFCVGMAFIIFFALCCCIPVVAFAYAMTIREGASEDDISSLPKYRFRQANPRRTFDDDRLKVEWARVESANRNHVNELCLHPEDSDCCICLSRYVEGVELCTLPCNHHFHCVCINRWLRINATCPLCKYNILRGDTLV